jgi:mannose/fructose/N-acetylgalactosamine-specific phosphotransferase system component IID
MKIQISNWTLTIYTAVEIDLNWIENVVQRLNYSFDQYKQFAYIFELTPFIRHAFLQSVELMKLIHAKT